LVIGDSEIDYGLVASITAAGVSTLGLVSMLAIGDWGRRNSAYFSAFAVGLLIVAVLFHLAPEALGEDLRAWRWMVAGFVAMTSVGFLLIMLAGPHADGRDVALGYASIIAVGAHSFLDGVVYETTFRHDLFTGGISTASLLLHEYPEGVIAFFLLSQAGMKPPTAFVWAFVIASLTTVAGAVGGSYVLAQFPGVQVSTLIGLTAGGLLYLIAFHLAPHAALTPKRRGYLLAGIGVIIGLAAVILHEVGPVARP
jgi:zinc transporter ZupT